ncbi:MAG: hypothetical protein WBE85_17250, partial [Methylocella sp.]
FLVKVVFLARSHSLRLYHGSAPGGSQGTGSLRNARAFAAQAPKPLAAILVITWQTYCFWAGLFAAPA